jgi:lysophospholipase L1-like esterase
MATASSGGIKVVIAALVVLLVAGCDGSQTRHGADAKSNSSGSTGGHRTSALRLVALGDSISTDEHCVGCTTFVDLYGRMVARRAGSPVKVENLSVPGSGVAGLVKQTTRDHRTRAALAHADIVTLTIGINDTPWNRVDDPRHVAPHYPFIEWRRITAQCTANVTHEYSSSLARVLHTITTLHQGKRRLLLRLSTVYKTPSWGTRSIPVGTLRRLWHRP